MRARSKKLKTLIKISQIKSLSYTKLLISISVTVGRSLWISLKECRVMVQMATRDPDYDDPLMRRVLHTYFFPELPASVCQNGTKFDSDGIPVEKGDPLAWHHYAISISFELDGSDITGSSLLVDGELVGSLESFTKPIKFVRPSKDFFPQL